MKVLSLYCGGGGLDEGLKQAMLWMIDTGKKHGIKKILISNRYSDDGNRSPREDVLYLVDGNYVPEDQAPKEVTRQRYG